jgi:hypothetical protein
LAKAFKVEEVTDEDDKELFTIYLIGKSVSVGNCNKLKNFSPSAQCIYNINPNADPNGKGSVDDYTKSKRLAIASIAHSRAGIRSQRRCGEYVRVAIESALVPRLFKRTRSASDFGPSLVAMGFRAIPANGQTTWNDVDNAIPGDVLIIHRFGTHQHGHAVVKTLTGWVSDFRQRKANPYRQIPPSITLYRFYGA